MGNTYFTNCEGLVIAGCAVLFLIGSYGLAVVAVDLGIEF